MPPTVSVLLPVRNAGELLLPALQSVSAQTFRDFEIVAVDDGSKDDSAAVLASYADPRLRVLRQTASGIVGALNAGLAMCRGTYVARMDADDLCHPERFAEQLAYFAAHPDVGVCATQVETFPPAHGMERYVAWMNELLDHDAIAGARFIESPVVHPSVMIRRALLSEYVSRGWPEDYELWLRLLSQGVRFGKVPRVLFSWRDHTARATRTNPVYERDRHRDLKLHYLLDGPLKDAPRLLFVGAGTEGKPFLRRLLALGRAPELIVDRDPRKVGQIIHGAPVVHPDHLSLQGEYVALAAVGMPRARPEIRETLAPFGFRDGENLWFLA